MRERGFYWLRSKQRWSIGKWSEGCWFVVGQDGWFEDSDFDEIDEKRIIRE